MQIQTSTAVAHPNIAFIKYWGNRDNTLRLPQNGSISMNLGGLTTRTMVTFNADLPKDLLDLNGVRQGGETLQRVTDHLNTIRGIRGISIRAHVMSDNDFPTGAGIASSSSAFAALTLAAVRAIGIEMEEKNLSRLSRRGSGSACRSIPAGFVEWYAGSTDSDSYAVTIAKPEYWDLCDCIAIVETSHKQVGSTAGHAAAQTSPLQKARVEDVDRRLDICRQAIRDRDMTALSLVIEQDSNLLHAVMMTSLPALYYWQPPTLEVMSAVQSWRRSGIPCAFTVDAGPNVHVLCESTFSELVQKKLESLPGVKEVLVSGVGGAAQLV